MHPDTASRQGQQWNGHLLSGEPDARDTGTSALLAIFLLLAPIPLGSNRPAFWAINAAAAALLLLLDAGRIAGARAAPMRRKLRWPAALFGATIAYLLVQIVPLPPDWSPSAREWAIAAEALGRPLPAPISLDPAATLATVLRFATYAVVFAIAARLASVSATAARRLVRMTFWIVVFHAGFALISLLLLDDTILGLPKWSYQGFATGPFVNRNSFATFAAFGATIGAALLADRLRGRPGAGEGHWLVDLAAFLVIATALVLSGSRTGVLAALAGVVCVLMIAAAGDHGRRRQVVWAAVAILVLTAGVVVYSGDALLQRFGDVVSDADTRAALYRQTLEMIAARPWTGYGGGAFADAFPPFHKPPLSPDYTWDAAHNTYLELAADLGIFAALPLLGLLWIALSTVSGIRRLGRPLAPVTALGVTTVAAIHSLSDFSLQIEGVALLFTALVGAGFGRAASRGTTVRPASAPTQDAGA